MSAFVFYLPPALSENRSTASAAPQARQARSSDSSAWRQAMEQAAQQNGEQSLSPAWPGLLAMSEFSAALSPSMLERSAAWQKLQANVQIGRQLDSQIESQIELQIKLQTSLQIKPQIDLPKTALPRCKEKTLQSDLSIALIPQEARPIAQQAIKQELQQELQQQLQKIDDERYATDAAGAVNDFSAVSSSSTFSSASSSLRWHIESSGDGLHVWLGSHARIEATVSQLIPHLTQHLMQWGGSQGLALISFVCNGRALYQAHSPSTDSFSNTKAAIKNTEKTGGGDGFERVDGLEGVEVFESIGRIEGVEGIKWVAELKRTEVLKIRDRGEIYGDRRSQQQHVANEWLGYAGFSKNFADAIELSRSIKTDG